MKVLLGSSSGFLHGLVATLFFLAQCFVNFFFFFQISVKDMKGRMFEFPVRDWIDAKEGVFAQAEYALSSNGFHDETIKPPVKPNPFGLSEFHISILFLGSSEVSCNTIYLQL